MTFSWLRLLRYAQHEKLGLTSLALLMIAATALGLVAPWPMKLIVDHVLLRKSLPQALVWIDAVPGAGSSLGVLRFLALSTVLLFLAQRAVAAAQAYIEAGVGTRMVYRL